MHTGPGLLGHLEKLRGIAAEGRVPAEQDVDEDPQTPPGAESAGLEDWAEAQAVRWAHGVGRKV